MMYMSVIILVVFFKSILITVKRLKLVVDFISLSLSLPSIFTHEERKEKLLSPSIYLQLLVYEYECKVTKVK